MFLSLKCELSDSFTEVHFLLDELLLLQSHVYSKIALLNGPLPFPVCLCLLLSSLLNTIFFKELRKQALIFIDFPHFFLHMFRSSLKCHLSLWSVCFAIYWLTAVFVKSCFSLYLFFWFRILQLIPRLLLSSQQFPLMVKPALEFVLELLKPFRKGSSVQHSLLFLFYSKRLLLLSHFSWVRLCVTP